jgi:hypothetical protein
MPPAAVTVHEPRLAAPLTPPHPTPPTCRRCSFGHRRLTRFELDAVVSAWLHVGEGMGITGLEKVPPRE